MSEQNEKLYLTADEAAKMMGVSKSHVYKVMRQMNKELKEMGYFVVSGKVNRKYFMERVDYISPNAKAKENS
ncbi:MAG: helix-turn-helix domain-containing protein [Clostridia bacterium]|jgi:DNA-binding transcriptional regulator GbsR (MarR family)|nr:helix-turn-helix domain-containing protein [Clostridia bacterium]